MFRRRTRWFRRLAAGLAFAAIAAPAAAKVDEGGNAAAAPQVIPYLSHGMTSADAAVVGNADALTHRQLEELAASRAIGNSDAMTHRQLEELAASRAIGNSDAMTHRQLEELAASRAIGNSDAMTHRQLDGIATAHATRFVPGVTDFPKAVTVEAPKVVNYLSHGMTAADAAALANGFSSQVSPAIQGELVKSRPAATIRPDDRADRFAISDTGSPATATDGGSGISWDGALTAGIGTLVLFLALGLGFAYTRRPRVAGL
jgi:hypothetical protein